MATKGASSDIAPRAEAGMVAASAGTVLFVSDPLESDCIVRSDVYPMCCLSLSTDNRCI